MGCTITIGTRTGTTAEEIGETDETGGIWIETTETAIGIMTI